MDVYEFKDYKKYLQSVLTTTGERRGTRSRLAKDISCQTSYISQVLGSYTHFSLEQCLKIGKFLGHTSGEQYFFMLIVQSSKAGSEDLKQFYNSQIDIILKERSKIKNRIKSKSSLTQEAHLEYYSHWYYSAIHMILDIKKYKTKDAIVKRLNLSLEIVSHTLDFLCLNGLIELKKGKYNILNTRVHLDSTSPLIASHHTNWRIEAIKSLEKMNTQNMHYSSVLMMSVEDSKKVKNILLNVLEEIEKVLIPSPSEELYSFSMDFFEA